ncbi:hypothetical protein [Streptomyces lasiicapitis]|uniref:hypothetical protein n=1 Tax=Streptomyces lasiicapitis TaxID=1923961 RepID=UPI00364FD4BD
MRRTTILISTGALTVAGGITGLILWLNQPSYDDRVQDCAAALKERAEGDKTKPDACEEVKDDDYMALVLSTAIDGLPEKDRDTLDYFDDGSINDSIG